MKRLFLISGITIIIIILLASLSYFLYFEPRSWGDEGELSIVLTIDKKVMGLDGQLNITEKITNSGSTKLRIIRPFMSLVRLYNSNNTTVEWVGRVADPPAPPTNDNLEILKPGENINLIHIVANWKWALEGNQTYRAISQYISSDHDDITLPYWKGEIWSNEVYFHVI